MQIEREKGANNSVDSVLMANSKYMRSIVACFSWENDNSNQQLYFVTGVSYLYFVTYRLLIMRVVWLYVISRQLDWSRELHMNQIGMQKHLCFEFKRLHILTWNVVDFIQNWLTLFSQWTNYFSHTQPLDWYLKFCLWIYSNLVLFSKKS